MADIILSPTVEKIIWGLGSAAVKEIALLWGVKDEITELENTISTIKSVLLDAEEKQVHNHQVRNWIKRLQSVVHEADDLMDDFSTEALRRSSAKPMLGDHIMTKQVRTFFSGSNQLAFRFKMGHKIREIKKKLAAISNDRNFVLEVRNEESGVVRRVREETHSFVPQEEVIGREEDRLAIIQLLFEGEFEENLSVIPVVGMGGLGKTTLAQSVFNDEKVQQCFELMIWVCVSENFDLKLIVQKIIKSVTNNNNLGDVDMDQLQKDLRKLLSGKQYILVLDDVWEENCEKWLKLKDLLVNGVNGSRVLVTTRSTIVAGITGTVNPYQLGILGEDRSWSLFERMAFKHGQEPKNSDKVNIGMEIVKRCGGIPLAIRTIGSMLRFKNSDSEWFLVNKEFSKVSQQIKRNDILPTLKLSYDHLPSHLKRCFAYCRLFPNDSHIGVPTLVELWIAQGFFELSDSSYQCLDDVGYRCFMELLERSFFQEVKVNDYGTIMGCKMHDLMHDLAILVGGTECANLDLNHEGNVDKDTHHVSLDFSLNSLEKLPTPLVQASRMRTILLFDQSSKKESGINTPILDAIILKFKFLRALDLSSSGIQIVPSSIGKLKHLRYLDLSRNYKIEELPDSITNLLNLQTLKISFCSQLKELPADIKKLVNLRHLEFSWYNRLTHMPHGLGRLTQLQTLSKYILSKSCETSPAPRLCGKLNELMTLNNLRGNLEIENLGRGNDAAAEAKAANLKEKQYLQSLFLNWEFSVDTNSTEASHGYEMSVLENLQPHMNLKNLSILNYGGAMFSSWLSSLTNLVDLSLINCVNCQYPVPLSQFHSLKRLRISNFPSLKHISDDGDDSFYLSFTPMTIVLPSLQDLWLEELPNLRGWWSKDLYHVVCGEVGDSFAAITTIPPVEANVRLLPSFPCLSKLVIRKCPLLTFMPLYPHLEEKLDLRETSLKPFQETMMSTINTGPSSLLSPLSKLRSLHIESRYEDLQFLKDSSKSLTSLKRLGISKCFGLKDLYPVIQHLASLQELSIGDCEDLDMLTSDNSIFWKAFNGRLHSLKLSSFRKMVALPHGIQYVTSLKELSIWYCESLTTIPEWIIDLKSLKKLEVWNCPSLTSLPEGIQRLTSLKRLEIRECPIILQGCRRQTGQVWPKIAHIPDLSLHPDPNADH